MKIKGHVGPVHHHNREMFRRYVSIFLVPKRKDVSLFLLVINRPINTLNLLYGTQVTDRVTVCTSNISDSPDGNNIKMWTTFSYSLDDFQWVNIHHLDPTLDRVSHFRPSYKSKLITFPTISSKVRKSREVEDGDVSFRRNIYKRKETIGDSGRVSQYTNERVWPQRTR